MLKRAATLALTGALFIAGGANAATVWVNADLTIDTFRAYSDGGSAIFEIKVKESFPSTSCTATDNGKIFSYWVSNQSANTFHGLLQAQAAYADAQQRTIEVAYSNTTCDPVVGRLLMGIRVKSAP